MHDTSRATGWLAVAAAIAVASLTGGCTSTPSWYPDCVLTAPCPEDASFDAGEASDVDAPDADATDQ